MKKKRTPGVDPQKPPLFCFICVFCRGWGNIKQQQQQQASKTASHRSCQCQSRSSLDLSSARDVPPDPPGLSRARRRLVRHSHTLGTFGLVPPDTDDRPKAKVTLSPVDRSEISSRAKSKSGQKVREVWGEKLQEPPPNIVHETTLPLSRVCPSWHHSRRCRVIVFVFRLSIRSSLVSAAAVLQGQHTAPRTPPSTDACIATGSSIF